MPYPDLAAEARDLIRTAFATLNRAPGHAAPFEEAQRHLAAAYRTLEASANETEPPADGLDALAKHFDKRPMS